MTTGSRHCLLACLSLSLSLILSLLPVADPLAGEPIKLDDRMRIFNALKEQGLLDKDRQLVHLVHLCNLVIDDEYYPVIDVNEYVRGTRRPHGVDRVLVLDSSLQLIKKIKYDDAANPLYCKDNQLFWVGLLSIDDLLPEGNVITFTEGGRKAVVSYMEPNDFPAQIPLQ